MLATCFRVSGFSFRVSGIGFRVSGFSFLVWNFGVSRFGFQLSAFQFRISRFALRVSGFGCRVSSFSSRVSGVGCGVWSVGFRVLVTDTDQRSAAPIEIPPCRTTSNQCGIKSSISIACMRVSSRRIPASARTYHRPEKKIFNPIVGAGGMREAPSPGPL